MKTLDFGQDQVFRDGIRMYWNMIAVGTKVLFIAALFDGPLPPPHPFENSS